MSVADNLIANEKIDVRSSKAWIAPVRDSVVPLVLGVIAFLVDWLSPNSTTGVAGWIGNVLDLIRLGLVVVAIGWIAYNIVVWRTAEFVVTNLRVIREEGFVSRRSSATLLTSISDVKSRVGLLGKGLHYGDLEIFTQSGGAGVDRFPLDHRAREVQERDPQPEDGRSPRCGRASPGGCLDAGRGSERGPDGPDRSGRFIPGRPRGPAIEPGRPARQGRDHARRIRCEEGRHPGPDVTATVPGIGRGGGIRTHDLVLPKHARCQASLRPAWNRPHDTRQPIP